MSYPHRIKLAFFDIDGTLLGLDGQYSDAVKRQCQRIQAMGIKTAIASGRPPFACQWLIDELKLLDTGMFYTGAMLYNPRTEQVLKHRALARAGVNGVAEVLSRAQALGLHCEVYSEHGYAVETITPITAVHAKHLRTQPQVVNLTEYSQSQSVVKLLIGYCDTAVTNAKNITSSDCKSNGVHPLPARTDIIAQLEQEFPSLVFARAYLAAHPEWHFASVIDAKACKYQAFDELLAHHGCTQEEVIAFGDAEADIPFIQQAGIGMAMGQANESVKQAANYVTAPVWDDGVAQALEYWLPT